MSSAAASDPYLDEIRGQPAAIRRAADAVRDQRASFELVAAAARERPRFVLTGMGSSHDACYPAVDHLAGRGIAALHANTAEILHFRLPLLTAWTIVVLVSQSGASAEVVHLLERLQAAGERRPFVVSVTNGTQNPAAEQADIAVDTRTGTETAPSSMTFAATLVHLGMLARMLADDDPARARWEIGEAATEAAEGVDAVLRDEDVVTTAIAGVARGRRLVALVGRGPARAAAEMGALTLKECGIVAEGFESAAFRHGPYELAGPDLGTIVVATEPRTRSLDLALAADLVETGSAVAVLADDGTTTNERGIVLPRADALLSPAISILPIQLAGHRLALEAGRQPGAYTVASKVTTRE
jgi:glucosamine--fructose-6-phosphate aminotransferase (isomerizing)